MVSLFHGDCLEVMKEIPAASVDTIICDLPYNTTSLAWDVLIPFEPLWKEYKRIIKPKGAIVLFGSQPFTSLLVASNLPMFRYEWVWDKKQCGNPFLAKKQPLKVHENILVFGNAPYYPIMRKGVMRKKGGGTGSKVFGNTDEKINDDYYPTSILPVPNCSNKKSKLHPTQKPVELLEYLIKTYSKESETVLDNCMGSGSTGIAAVRTGRNFIGIEKDFNYFSIASERIREEQNQMGMMLFGRRD